MSCRSATSSSANWSARCRSITSGLDRDDRVVVGELWRATPGMKVTPKLTTLGD